MICVKYMNSEIYYDYGTEYKKSRYIMNIYDAKYINWVYYYSDTEYIKSEIYHKFLGCKIYKLWDILWLWYRIYTLWDILWIYRMQNI